MDFDPSQTADTLCPLFMEDALADISVFGPDKVDIESVVQEALQSRLPDEDIVVDQEASITPLPRSFSEATTAAEMLQVLRKYADEVLHPQTGKGRLSEKSPSPLEPATNQELHEKLLKTTMDTSGFPKAAQIVLDHIMLLRAQERYLFNYEMNHQILADDPWLQDVWSWIGGKSNVRRGLSLADGS